MNFAMAVVTLVARSGSHRGLSMLPVVPIVSVPIMSMQTFPE
jgi:hypothetical protein